MTRIVIVLSVLIFALALYSNYLSNDTLKFRENTETHLNIVTVANEISSYAKRAEGHLFLYLMNHDSVDRGKFFKRMQSLKVNIDLIKDILKHQEPNYHADELMDFHKKALTYGEKILQQYDADISNGTHFNFTNAKEDINTFHSATSDIRRKAVKMVEQFAGSLKNQQNQTINNLNTGKWLVLLIVIACVGLLVMISIMAKRMSRLSLQLKRFSYVDSLTGIANRRAFEDKLNMEWKRSLREKTNLSLLLIDVDSFKLVNDSRGHHYGDECLINIARALQGCLKRPTDMVARYGGEEFAIILPNTSEAMMVAEQCRKAVTKLPSPFEDGKILSITIGVGDITVTPELDKEMVIEKIDEALYRGKAEGKNKVVLANL